MSEISTTEYVEAYLAIRNERERILHEYETMDKELKAEMAILETGLLDICNTIGANSINTKYGTVIRSIKERATCGDWDNFKKFVLENQLVDLLEKRIHQTNFKTFMEEHSEDGLPPGVSVMREFAITVRKAK